MSLRISLFALLLAVSGCNCPGTYCPVDYPCPDAGRIADAGLDARRDAGRDGGRDGGIDADAPLGPSDPGWVHIAALPDECEIDVAMYPERVLPVGVWENADCGAGCRRWASSANLIYVGDSGGTPLTTTIGGAPEVGRYTVFSESQSGRAVFALRDRYGAPAADDAPFCIVHGQAVGSGALAVTARFVDFDASGRFVERSWLSVLRHELVDATTSVRALVHRDGLELLASHMAVSPTHVGLLFENAVPALIGNDGTYVVPTFGTGDALTKTNIEMTGGAELFWEAWREPTVLVRSSNGAPPEVMRAVAGGDLRSFTSDGTDFVWLEARGRDEATRTYASVELWTATYDGTTLHAPRLVRTIPSHYDGTVGGGYYVHPEPNPLDATDADFVFYRLSDGARALVDLPLPANEVLWVSEDDSVLEALGQRYRIDPRSLTFE